MPTHDRTQWPAWAQQHFPCDFPIDEWSPVTDYKALDSRVLIVMTTRIEGTWRAYIGVVSGYSHNAEWPTVLDQGSPAQESVARACFPSMKAIPYSP